MLNTLAEYGLSQLPSPLVLRRVDVELGAVRAQIERVFRALIRDRTLCARKRRFLGIRFDEVLADFRPDHFEEEAKVCDDRIVAPNRVMRLAVIPDANTREY